MNVWALMGAFVFGAAVSEFYNWRIWKAYFRGKGDRYGSRK